MGPFKEMLNSKELMGYQVLIISILSSIVVMIIGFSCRKICGFLKYWITVLNNKLKTYFRHKKGKYKAREFIDLENKINLNKPLNRKEKRIKKVYDEQISDIKIKM